VSDLHPSAGVRILLELCDADDAQARYRAALYTPTSRLDYRLSIARTDGTVAITETPADDSPAYTELLHAMARSLARDALASTPFHWPSRLLRWRDK
jgi:hypothetical protein